MLFELINPSDPYTFEADNAETAALVVLLLSNAYGAEDENKEERVPIFLFGGAEEWYLDKYKRTAGEGLVIKKKEVIKALRSFVYGTFSERHRYEAERAQIDNIKKKKNFENQWCDKHGSMNDIKKYAEQIADKLDRDKYLEG